MEAPGAPGGALLRAWFGDSSGCPVRRAFEALQVRRPWTGCLEFGKPQNNLLS